MRILIMETSGISAKTMNLHVRASRALASDWQRRGATVDLITIIGSDDGLPGFLAAMRADPYDVIVMHYSSWYVHVNRFNALMERNIKAKRVWLTSDYEISIYHTFAPIDLCISNFVESIYAGKNKFYDRYCLANLNTLTFDGRHRAKEKMHDSIYYGRYREDRARYFNKYLSHPEMYLSTSKKNMQYFKKDGARCRLINKMSWTPHQETLQMFRSSLYIEDVFTHQHFNHLGTRFYEGITCNTPVYFDQSVRGTIEKSGYEIDPFFMVDSPEELLDKTKKQSAEMVEAALTKYEAEARAERSRTYETIWASIKNLL